ncbi:MAG: hypothetical protein JXA46_18625 [Dehalococcoidales bacterium]|nr:hypothetical protein [Dehalococcoidales bacterium]
MKVLVAYMSQTGNTKRVAQVIYDEIPEQKEIKEIKDVSTIEGYDLTFIGFPIIQFGPPTDIAGFLTEKAQGKNVALFITHSAPEESIELQEWLGKCKQAAAGSNLKGVFNCQGELGQQVADYMMKSGNEMLINWAKMRPSTLGQPDASRLKRARAWAKDMVKNPE